MSLAQAEVVCGVPGAETGLPRHGEKSGPRKGSATVEELSGFLVAGTQESKPNSS